MIFSQTIVIISLISIFGAMSSIIKKHVLNVFTPLEFLTATFFLEFIFMGILLLHSGKFLHHIKTIKEKVSAKEIGYVIAFSIFITGAVYWVTILTKKESISKIAPMFAIMDVILNFFGGVYLLGEDARPKDFLAILCMIVGIAIMSY